MFLKVKKTLKGSPSESLEDIKSNVMIA